MSAILLSALFIASGILAVTAIALTGQRYGSATLALRGELANCDEWREVRVRISEVTVCSTATVLRPNFSRAGRPSSASAHPSAAA